MYYTTKTRKMEGAVCVTCREESSAVTIVLKWFVKTNDGKRMKGALP
jgi:hypothetical protein